LFCGGGGGRGEGDEVGEGSQADVNNSERLTFVRDPNVGFKMI